MVEDEIVGPRSPQTPVAAGSIGPAIPLAELIDRSRHIMRMPSAAHVLDLIGARRYDRASILIDSLQHDAYACARLAQNHRGTIDANLDDANVRDPRNIAFKVYSHDVAGKLGGTPNLSYGIQDVRRNERSFGNFHEAMHAAATYEAIRQFARVSYMLATRDNSADRLLFWNLPLLFKGMGCENLSEVPSVPISTSMFFAAVQYVNNARSHAFKGEGALPKEKRSIGITSYINENGYCLEVSDNGNGINPVNFPSIFYGKSTREGLERGGWGLQMVRELASVKWHGKTKGISVETIRGLTKYSFSVSDGEVDHYRKSKGEKGTTMSFYYKLPRARR